MGWVADRVTLDGIPPTGGSFQVSGPTLYSAHLCPYRKT